MFPAPTSRLATLSCLLLLTTPLLADDPCNPTDPEQEPASGNWKGTLDQRTNFRRQMQAASVNMAQTWHGTLEFILAHDTEYDERYQPEPPCLRVPAGHPPIEGCRSDGKRVDPNKAFKIVRVPKDGKPHLSGDARLTQSMSFAAAVAGARERGNGTTMPGQTESLNPELVLAGERIEAISLVGEPDKFRLGNQFSFADRNSATTGTVSGTVSGNGASQEHIRAQGPSGSVDMTSSRDASGGGATHGVHTGPDGKTHTDDFSTPGRSGSGSSINFVEVFRMTLDRRECGFMKGKIDTSSMKSQMGGAGFSVDVPQAEWSAELQERDKAFEAEVAHLAAEPIPATLTWEYVNGFIARLQGLMAKHKTDYGQCVLRKAQAKGVRVQMQAVRTLIASYPSRCEGATDAVFNAANERLMSLIRPLGFLGLESCPDVQRAWQTVQGSTERQANCPQVSR